MFVGTDFTFIGGPCDDEELLPLLPEPLSELLKVRNGFVCYRGALHLRGAVRGPRWHSLRDAWEGEAALYRLYPSLLASDVPFGEDCVGDQFLLRERAVIRLAAETGDVEELGISFTEFLNHCERDPVEFLLMHPLLQVEREGGRLEPGWLIHAYPPFCTSEAEQGVSLRPVPAEELIAFHADLARKIGQMTDGQRIRIQVE